MFYWGYCIKNSKFVELISFIPIKMKTNTLQFFITVSILLFVVFANAQDKVMQGVVTTLDSIPLHGASVRVASTKQVVLTDTVGNFTVSCNNKDKLKVTANGFFTENVKIESSTTFAAINLRLKAGAKNLKVASAFTNVADYERLTAMTSRSSNELDFSVYSNFFDAIKGKFPGLEVQGTDLIIRGVGSINGSRPALVVLDGTVVQGATLNAINPSTVKRVNVIKDGSAAIYGSRAAFGVVEITTKSGKD